MSEDEEKTSKKKFKKLSCWDRALNLLSMREHSCSELRQKLRKAGHDPKEVEESIERALELDFLNERRFLSAKLRYLLRRGQGPMKIKAAVAQARVEWDEELFNELKEELGGNELEEEQITHLLEKKIRSSKIQKELSEISRTSSMEFLKLKQKLLSFLQQRGFHALEHAELAEKLLAEAVESKD